DVGSTGRQGFDTGTGGRTGAMAAALAGVGASRAFGDSAALGVSIVFDDSEGFGASGVATEGVAGASDSVRTGALGLSAAGGRTSITDPRRAACGADLVPGDKMTYPEAIATHNSSTMEPPSRKSRRVERCGVSNMWSFDNSGLPNFVTRKFCNSPSM